MRNIVPSVYVRTEARGLTQDLGHSFSQYGPPGWECCFPLWCEMVLQVRFTMVGCGVSYAILRHALGYCNMVLG